jgi:jumonji domain-containing protein 7
MLGHPGNSKSTTALHKDPYENIYIQIRGQKHFTLLPPHASACVNDAVLPAATYNPLPKTSEANGIPQELVETLDEPSESVPFPTWDPDCPDKNPTRFSALCQPLRVTLGPGDMLYLPALWFHKVGQSCGEEGFCCAVNYW